MKNVKKAVVYLHLLWYNTMGSVLLVSVILELIDIRPDHGRTRRIWMKVVSSVKCLSNVVSLPVPCRVCLDWPLTSVFFFL